MILYCCGRIYKAVLKAGLLHENLSYRPFNLIVKRETLLLYNKDASFLYKKTFNGYIEIYHFKLQFLFSSSAKTEQRKTLHLQL